MLSVYERMRGVVFGGGKGFTALLMETKGKENGRGKEGETGKEKGEGKWKVKGVVKENGDGMRRKRH